MTRSLPPQAVSAFAVGLALLLSACGSTELFRAGFDRDAPGAAPAEHPPGDPSGDRIYASATLGGAASSGLLRVAGNGPGSANGLQYSNVNEPAHNRFVGFIPKPGAWRTDKTYYAYWNGNLQLDPAGSSLAVFLGNGHFAPIVSLKFEGGTVSARASEGDGFEPIGTYAEGRDHLVIISVDQAARTYALSFIQGGHTFNVQDRPIVDQGASPSPPVETNQPVLYLLFDEDKSGAGRYLLDNVTISEKEPDPEEMM